MSDAELLKKEIDTSGNEILEAQEMEEFLKSEENIKKLWETMKSNISPELLWEMEDALKILCENFLTLDNLTDQQNQILSFFTERFWDKYPDFNTQLQNKQIMILNNEIEKELNSLPIDYITNLQELWIDTAYQNNKKRQWIIWENVVKDIKEIDHLEKITENNINQYVSIPDNIPKTNYAPIAENVKNILYTHIKLNPGWNSILQKWWLSTGMSLDSILKDDNYKLNLYKTLDKLKNKSIDEQLDFIVVWLPKNSDLLDLWIKLNLNEKNQEIILPNIYDKIPVQESSKFFQACENNSFLGELKSNYALYQLNKNKSIKTDNKNYCFLNWQNKSDFETFYNKWIKLSDELSFDELYKYTENFYIEMQNFW